MFRILFFLLSLTFVSFGQSFQDKYQIHASKSAKPVIIDGKLDDDIWKKAESIGDFWQKFPTADVKAKLNTTAQVAYDDKYLYFAITCYDSVKNYVAPTLKRDGSIRESDGVAVILDPQNKKTNGFSFSATPFNVQTEYLIGGSSDGPGGVNTAWDNKWFSQVDKTSQGYTVEMAIPFKTLRYDPKNKIWGLNFIRSDQANYKFYTWTNVPVQFPGFDLGYVGTLVFDDIVPSASKNYAIIPFVTGGVSVNNEVAGSVKGTFGAGLDAKLSLTPSINMDFTLLPDFSQVDVDQQVTNLTRFSVFFPEKRTFFLENDDVFSDYGSPPIKPFFSRRIGLDKNNNPIPIIFGAKVSGNLTNKLRIGAFNMQTANKGDYNAQNFTALSLIQRLGKRSTIKGYVHNVSTNLGKNDNASNAFSKFGRNEGLEINYIDAAGKYNAWAGYHISQKPNTNKDNSFAQLGGGYNGKNLSFFSDYFEVKNNYFTDMGFVNRIETLSTIKDTYAAGDTTYRNGFKQNFTMLSYAIRPKNSIVASHIFSIENYYNWFQDNTLTERSQGLAYIASLQNSSSVNISLNYSHEFLKYYFPLPSIKPLRPGVYDYFNGSANYKSDTRKNVFWMAKIKIGQFYNGYLNQYAAQFSVRKQPWWTIALNAEYNIIKFPTEYGSTKLLLFSPKTEINFSNKMFWTTFFQFNTQANNFNINSRLQYRYSPMSDFFLVFTDNYFTDPLFKNKNRGLVFKLNYWIS
jgi:Carbohydrate family 9 binding domain-like/Domain of unknown function (DUF5916)